MATSTYTPLYTNTLTSTASSVTITVPSGYTDIRFVGSLLSSSGNAAIIQVNSDTGSNYSRQRVLGTGSAASAYEYSSQTRWISDAVSTTASTFGVLTLDLMNYASTTTYKTCIARDSSNLYTAAWVGLWRGSTGSAVNQPITSITFTPDSGVWSIGSTFSLYGIAAAPSAKATGGMITSDATYYYHTFLSSGTFTPTQSLSAAILVVGGGGGSGYGNNAGSGGAGGYLEGTGIALTATAYTVTVGGGGTTSWPSAGDGTAGVDSSFGSIGTAFGGGRGSGTTSRNGGNGGSGGGGGYDGSGYGTGGTATQTSQNGLTGFGNNGGGGVSVAGGGGAGGAASGTTGGAGKTSSLMGGTYAVGATGGGVGPNVTPTQNTGNSGPQGSAGGSGIVIVRYAK